MLDFLVSASRNTLYTVKVAQSCLTLCDPMDCIHGILQTRIPEWIAFPFSRGSSQPRDQSQVSRMAGGFFTSWATKEDPLGTHGVSNSPHLWFPCYFYFSMYDNSKKIRSRDCWLFKTKNVLWNIKLSAGCCGCLWGVFSKRSGLSESSYRNVFLLGYIDSV